MHASFVTAQLQMRFEQLSCCNYKTYLVVLFSAAYSIVSSILLFLLLILKFKLQ